MNIKVATVWIDPESRKIALRTPYDPEFIDALKKAIPWQCREWKKEKKVWLVDIASKGALEELLLDAGYMINDGTLPTEEAPAHNGASPYHDLIAKLPFAVLKKVYRVIALECHPDRGGDTKLMVQVNAAWERINDDRAGS